MPWCWWGIIIVYKQNTLLSYILNLHVATAPDLQFEDTKGLIRIRISENRQNIAKRKMKKRQTTIYKILHTKNKDRVILTPLKPGVKSGSPEG